MHSECSSIKSDPPVIKRKPFTEEEIKMLWENLEYPCVDMIIIGIYTGFRPSELISIKVDDINTKEMYIIGGMKTDSGKNRIVPIHSKIRKIVTEKIKNAETGSKEFLFTLPNGECFNYFKYRNCFNIVMRELDMKHSPHDTRHTFITLGKEAGMDEYALKLIAGHTINDITEHIYTHRKISGLKKEIEKIK